MPVDVLVGDLDSIADDRLLALEAGGVPIEAWPAEKDATDAELALRAALRHEPERIVVLGATGGDRLDHALANVALLGHADLAGRDVALLDGSSRTRLLRGPGEAVLAGRAGDLVSLIPVGEAAHMVTTSGLAYPLTGEGLATGTSRGISNVRLATTAGVRLERGRLLIIETTSS